MQGYAYFSYFWSKTHIVGTRRGGSNVYPQCMFWVKILKEKIKIFLLNSRKKTPLYIT